MSDAPSHLSPEAKEEWDRLIADPALSQSLGLENRAAIAIYCQNWARMAASERNLNDNGVIVPAPRTGAPMVNPHVGIAAKAAEAVGKATRRVGNGPGHGGPAKGSGGPELWGGPAKGPGRGGDAQPFTADSPTRTAPRTLNSAERRLLRAERTARLEDMLFELAEQSEKDETRVLAAVRLHAIMNGQPVATNINLGADDVSGLTDNELAAELARTNGAAADLAAGGMAPEMPAEP